MPRGTGPRVGPSDGRAHCFLCTVEFVCAEIYAGMSGCCECSSQVQFAVAEYARQQSRGTSEGVVAESCFIASVGWKSFKGSMNRVVWRRESASETRRAGRVKVSGRRRGLALTHASSHESLQCQSFKGTIGEEERRLIMLDSESAKCDICLCICITRYCRI